MSGCASPFSSPAWFVSVGAFSGATALRVAGPPKKYQSAPAARVDDARSDLSHLPIEERCENWGKWCRRSKSGGNSIASLEGNWRSPQRSHWDEPPPPVVRGTTNTLDAQLLEHAAGILELYDHAILRAWHVYRYHPALAMRRAAKLARIPRGNLRDWDGHLAAAYRALERALTLPAVVRRDRARALVLAALDPESVDSEELP